MNKLKYLACVLCVLLCAGCATMPTAGPVLATPREVLEEGPGGFTIEPEPPPQGAPPSMIIRGFLTAMASVGQDYATAREYLTEEASGRWHPADTDALIYASGTTPSVEETTMQVTMSGPLVGYLHPDGSFVSSEDPTWTHDFGMVREDGEWRISAPPEGLALSQYMFSQSFMRIDAYFFPASGETLVPDPRYVPRTAWDRTTAARLVLDGPSDWLGDIVAPEVRTDIALDGDVTLSNGVADVPLDCGSGRPEAVDATQLAIEIAATMRDMTGVSRVRLTCDGTPVPLAGAAQDASLPLTIVDDYDSSHAASVETLAAVHDGVVALLGDGDFIPVPGQWDAAHYTIGSFALSPDLGQIAAVTDQGLVIGPVGDGSAVLAIPGEGFLRPQLDSRGNLWAVRTVDHVPMVSVVTRDDLTRSITDQKPPPFSTLDTSALGDIDILGFQVSPDGHRILLIRQADTAEGAQIEVGICLITYADDQAASLISWKPIRLIWEGAQLKTFADLAWMGPSSFVLLASSGAAPPEVFVTNIDGLEMDEWGLPQRLDSVDADQKRAVEMAAHYTGASPQIVVREKDGTIWSYQDGYQWRLLGDSVTSIAFPG